MELTFQSQPKISTMSPLMTTPVLMGTQTSSFCSSGVLLKLWEGPPMIMAWDGFTSGLPNKLS